MNHTKFVSVISEALFTCISLEITVIILDKLYGFFCPFRISLNVMTLSVESPLVYTRHGVPISVNGIAQVMYIHIY